MSQELNTAAGDEGRQLLIDDEFYVRRINWLVTLGRTDLIDEIADDCERRRGAPHRPHVPPRNDERRPCAGDARSRGPT